MGGVFMSEEKKNVIAFMNMKGGVGKTTLCVNLADAISKLYDKNVLLIDFDPQSNATQYILRPDEYKEILKCNKTVYEIFRGFVEDNIDYNMIDDTDCDEENDKKEFDIIYEVNSKFHLIPGDLKMIKISQNNDSVLALQLNEYIKTIKEKYDYIFIDCPPTQSIYTQGTLLATNYYILPVKPDYLSSLGMDLFQAMIKKHNNTSPKKVKCFGIVFTMVQKSDYYEEKMKEIRDRKKFTVFTNTMKHNANVARNSEEHKLFLDINGKKTEIKKIAHEFMNRFDNE